jgi:hypothetical protein
MTIPTAEQAPADLVHILRDMRSPLSLHAADRIEALERELASRSTIAAPGDWVWVPREPTEEMQAAILEAVKDGILINDDAERSIRHAYRAMLSASPPTPTQAPDGVDDLCRKMWPDSPWWGTIASETIALNPGHWWDGERDKQRARMTAFLQVAGLSSVSPVKPK